jgi:tape measure domain-containing protein
MQSGGGGIGLGSIVGGNLLAQGITSAASGMGDLVSQGFAYNSAIEQATTSFTVMLGSLGNATRLMDQLRTFAAKTPFELPTLNKAAVSLLSTKKIAQGQVLPILTKLGDAAAGSSEGFAAMPRITRAVAQMLTKGKIQAEEMMQLSEAGVPAWSALAQQMGKSTAEVQKLGEQGKLGTKEIMMLVEGLGKQYEGLADKQSKTFSGLGSTIKDNVGKALGDASKPLYDLTTKGMAKLVAMMDSPVFQSWVDKVAGGFETAIALGTKLVNSPLARGVAMFAALSAGALVLVGAIGLAGSAISIAWSAAAAARPWRPRTSRSRWT